MHAPTAETGPNRSSFLIPLFTDRRIAAGSILGFSSGMTFPLIYATQSVWLTREGVSIETIGWLFALTIPYKFKFLWAPFLERYDVPGLSALLGRRRGWIVLSQIGILGTLVGIAFGDPAHWLWWTIGFSLALSVAGATQDITIDGWRIAVVPKAKLPLMSSWAEMGWRVGTLAAGAGALLIADKHGWTIAYLVMAALMLPGMIAAWIAPEPDCDKRASREPMSFITTIWTPIKDLLARLGPMAIPRSSS